MLLLSVLCPQRDGSTRSEDDAIAYTWRRFIDNPGDPEILYRMPMTKVCYFKKHMCFSSVVVASIIPYI